MCVINKSSAIYCVFLFYCFALNPGLIRGIFSSETFLCLIMHGLLFISSDVAGGIITVEPAILNPNLCYINTRLHA